MLVEDLTTNTERKEIIINIKVLRDSFSFSILELIILIKTAGKIYKTCEFLKPKNQLL